jgi:hypothetical protein
MKSYQNILELKRLEEKFIKNLENNEPIESLDLLIETAI